ncbi:MAG: hypothetical protein K940chlam5_00325, partial [Candidatus Anoxychlamydiales bacterium]|nr:hypothetical protein [Candidatus Anoxychlamydiales bacterium]
MITLPTRMPTADEITDFIKWPIQEKENAIRTAIPVVTLLASKMFTNLSSFFSLVLATGVCAGTEIINHQMNPETPTPARENPPASLKAKRRKRKPARQAMQALVSEEQSQRNELKR